MATEKNALEELLDMIRKLSDQGTHIEETTRSFMEDRGDMSGEEIERVLAVRVPVMFTYAQTTAICGLLDVLVRTGVGESATNQALINFFRDKITDAAVDAVAKMGL